MSDEVVLYTYPKSRGRVAHWLLEELNVPYRLEIVRIERNETRTPQFLAINPMGKLPTIIHRGVVVTEAAAICTYLADAFPAAGFAPAITDPQRGTYLRWLFFAAGCYEAAMFDKISPHVHPIPKDALGYGSYEDVLNTLEIALRGRPYLLGDRVSAADLYVAAQLSFSILMKRVDPTPTFTDYVQRMESRPAHVRMAKKCDALLEEMDLPPITYPT